jgi:competence ComEA-like helix-hairpin-helix protein
MIAIKRTLLIAMAYIVAPYFVSFAVAIDKPETETLEPERLLVEGHLNINTATVDQFVMLPGIDRFEAGNIVDYRSTNGNFNAIDDLLKIKGIRRLEYRRLQAFLTLEGETTLRSKKILAPVEGRLNINTATADQFVMLPGIDRFEAGNIVDYRNANGKFNAIDDLLKVKGVRRLEHKRYRDFLTLEGETTLQRKKRLALVKGRININTATVDQFAMLPGIDKFEAGNIIDYRNANGKFNTIDDLLKIKGIRRLEYKRFKDFLTLKGETTIKHKIKLY